MIRLVRLDYRLLHGQVVFSWCSYVGVQRIIVVDDDGARDEFKKAALSLSKPAGVRLNIFSLETALAKMGKVEILSETVMMIFGNTSTLLQFCQQYPKIKEINYGGLANKPGARQYGSAIFMTAGEVEDTRKLKEMGIKLYVQQTPNSKVESMNL